MIHSYYTYTKEQLLKSPKLGWNTYETKEEVFRQMAQEMAEEIEEHNKKGEKTVFICPVGPVGQYPYFVEIVNQKRINLKNVWFFNMDEYLTDEKEWIDMSHPLSFRGFMYRTVYDKIDPELVMPEEQRVFPDPKDPEKVTRMLEKLGWADVCFGGIGLNGHLAFNEADQTLTKEAFVEQKTRLLHISQETRAANAIGDFNGALEDMPNYCMTVGMYEIIRSRKVRLGCFRNWHKAVVRRAAYGEATTEFPVTLLQNHADISIRFTEEVAQL